MSPTACASVPPVAGAKISAPGTHGVRFDRSCSKIRVLTVLGEPTGDGTRNRWSNRFTCIWSTGSVRDCWGGSCRRASCTMTFRSASLGPPGEEGSLPLVYLSLVGPVEGSGHLPTRLHEDMIASSVPSGSNVKSASRKRGQRPRGQGGADAFRRRRGSQTALRRAGRRAHSKSGRWRTARKTSSEKSSKSPDRIRGRYAVQTVRLEPVGIVYLWPEMG